MKKTTSWGSVARWYKDHLMDEDSYHAQVVLPNLTRVMDIQPGEKVLDLACGTGFFSGVFKEAGAEVVGVDIGKELIAVAKTHAPDVAFYVSSAHDLSMIKDRSIDKIALVLAIQNIREVKETLAECARVLREKGELFIVMNHPAFRIPKRSDWGWDEGAHKMYRRIDGYLSEAESEIVMHPGKKNSAKTISFHRPIQYYAKLLESAGFAISRIEEWNSHKSSESGPRKKEEDRMRKEIPLFMLLKAKKGLL